MIPMNRRFFLLAAAVSFLAVDVVSGRASETSSVAFVPAGHGLSADDGVCVVGGGSIGSSFCAVFLARGKSVVCSDPYVDENALHQRIETLWPTIKARGLTRRSTPPFDLLRFESDLPKALAGKKLVQECTFEDVRNKQKVLAELDQLADPTAIIASSTSHIPHNLLVTRIKNNKERVIVGHPTIPHLDSFMEVYGTNPEWVAQAKEYYQQLGFDVVTMQKTMPGHIFNSFLNLNMRHGADLVRKGVCSPEDVNIALRHLGRDLYARNTYLTLLSTIGGERGLEGGLALSAAIKNSAISTVFFSLMKKFWMPDWIATRFGNLMARLLGNIVEPPPPTAWIESCQQLEDKVTQQQTLPVQTGLFKACEPMYKRAAYEVDNDPFRMI